MDNVCTYVKLVVYTNLWYTLKYRHTTHVDLTAITSVLQNNGWLVSFIFSYIFHKYLLVLWWGKKKPRKKSLFHNPFKKRHWAQFLVGISGGNYHRLLPPPPPTEVHGYWHHLCLLPGAGDTDRSAPPEWLSDTKLLRTRRYKFYHCGISSRKQTEDNQGGVAQEMKDKRVLEERAKKEGCVKQKKLGGKKCGDVGMGEK